MYTRCPRCRTVYRMSAAQLRRGQGRAICSRCSRVFTALQNLADSLPEALADDPSPLLEPPRLGRDSAIIIAPDDSAHGTPRREPAPFGAHAKATPPVYWRVGTGLLTLVLLFQILHFEGERLAHNAVLWPLLETVCQHIGCTPPPFRDHAAIEVVDRALYPARDPGDGYEFHLVLLNHAPYPQPCPSIDLSLTALDGTLLARRTFRPEEYLPPHAPSVLSSHRMLFIHLDLLPLQRPVGGFQFGLPE